MGSHRPFGHRKHKLWPKERSGIKLAIWLLTTKSQELTRFPCVQMACDILLESFQRGLQLCFRPHLNQRSAHKVMAPQSRRSPNLGNFLGQKNHLDVSPVERCRVYYKGEGGGFPQVRAMVSLVCSCCSWFVLTPKVLQLCTNHFALVLCRFVWGDKACQLFLVPSWSSSMPLYPSKVLRTKECAPTPYSSIVLSFLTHIWVLQGVGSASLCEHIWGIHLRRHYTPLTSNVWGKKMVNNVESLGFDRCWLVFQFLGDFLVLIPNIFQGISFHSILVFPPPPPPFFFSNMRPNYNFNALTWG